MTLAPHIAPHLRRRARLAQQIGKGVAIVPTAPERTRNRDAHYPYRYDSYFYHLTGFTEPEAVLVIVAGAGLDSKPRNLLFCREKNEEREIWDGFRHGPAAAHADAVVAALAPVTAPSSHDWRTRAIAAEVVAALRSIQVAGMPNEGSLTCKPGMGAAPSGGGGVKTDGTAERNAHSRTVASVVPVTTRVNRATWP